MRPAVRRLAVGGRARLPAYVQVRHEREPDRQVEIAIARDLPESLPVRRSFPMAPEAESTESTPRRAAAIREAAAAPATAHRASRARNRCGESACGVRP